MTNLVTSLALAALLLPSPPPDQPWVRLSVGSTQNGQTIKPTSFFDWHIDCAVQPTGNLGLTGFYVDLVQDAANPSPLDITAADGVPAAMQGFSRPSGICNPGIGGAATGYIGTPLGPTGGKNLRQIGGIQNTLGIPAGGIGTDTTVESGVGQGAQPVRVASGSFNAPLQPGTYAVRLERAGANVLVEHHPAPAQSFVTSARTVLDNVLIFTVDCVADFNNDGGVDGADIEAFYLAWEAGQPEADTNGSGGIDGDDVQVFFQQWTLGGC